MSDEKLISVVDNTSYYHLSAERIPPGGLHKVVQPLITGYNLGGRPIGLWFALGNRWLRKIQQFDKRIWPTCCFLYKVVINPARVLHLRTEADFEKFDAVIPSYWVNYDYFTVDIYDYISTLHINEAARKQYPGDIPTTYEDLLKCGLIFESADAAREGSVFYNKYSDYVERLKLKRWDMCLEKWSGIIFENWSHKNRKAMNYFWFQSLDIKSGCIWDPSAILSMRKMYSKVQSASAQGVQGTDTNISADIDTDSAPSSASTNTMHIRPGAYDPPQPCHSPHLFSNRCQGDDPSSHLCCDRCQGHDISGAFERYESDHQAEAIKDKVIAKLMPEVITPCALVANAQSPCTCADEKTQEAIHSITGKSMTEAMAAEGCSTEKCLVHKLRPDLERKLGRDHVIGALLRYKPKGPTDSRLLSNVHIDEVLQQWGRHFEWFYPYNFNMLNYAQYSLRDGAVIHAPDTLATVRFADLVSRGYRACACVINSDLYQGPGKHWMALFADTRSRTIEFFNSSGNPPAQEWIDWMTSTRNELEALEARSESAPGSAPSRAPYALVNVIDIRHQQSKSECGLYSLFYIWARLNGVAPDYFRKVPVRDQLMFEFRHHLFDGPSGCTKFDWKKYTERVKVTWE